LGANDSVPRLGNQTKAAFHAEALEGTVLEHGEFEDDEEDLDREVVKPRKSDRQGLGVLVTNITYMSSEVAKNRFDVAGPLIELGSVDDSGSGEVFEKLDILNDMALDLHDEG